MSRGMSWGGRGSSQEGNKHGWVALGTVCHTVFQQHARLPQQPSRQTPPFQTDSSLQVFLQSNHAGMDGPKESQGFVLCMCCVDPDGPRRGEALLLLILATAPCCDLPRHKRRQDLLSHQEGILASRPTSCLSRGLPKR